MYYNIGKYNKNKWDDRFFLIFITIIINLGLYYINYYLGHVMTEFHMIYLYLKYI